MGRVTDCRLLSFRPSVCLIAPKFRMEGHTNLKFRNNWQYHILADGSRSHMPTHIPICSTLLLRNA